MFNIRTLKFKKSFYSLSLSLFFVVMVQGMCFSLPTLEDPFNDKYMNLDSKKTKKVWPSKKDNNLTENGSNASQNKRKANSDHKSNEKNQKKKARVEKESTPSDEKSTKKLNTNISTDVGCPSKFLISCLKTVQDTMRDDKAFERGKHLFFDSWGFEYWRCYTSGKHVLETSGCATMEQIAWIGSTAVDSITKKENDGESFPGPYLLFIVPSQEKAAEVRAVCKPLKAFGIHTVSLHPGASIDHQIQGLKTCEPEFLICTPDRLVELVSMDAVDISGVRSLVFFLNLFFYIVHAKGCKRTERTRTRPCSCSFVKEINVFMNTYRTKLSVRVRSLRKWTCSCSFVKEINVFTNCS
ncbi:putative RNA helicase [Helianthus annuus]|nr:putative RNA helicase [Helianthus annuus]